MVVIPVPESRKFSDISRGLVTGYIDYDMRDVMFETKVTRK
jgi:hypothetical protein